jgi:isoleucyl-tRNA synthetase
VLAWTTTPWTLPSNLALAVNEKMNYTCVVKDKILIYTWIICNKSLRKRPGHYR